MKTLPLPSAFLLLAAATSCMALVHCASDKPSPNAGGDGGAVTPNAGEGEPAPSVAPTSRARFPLGSTFVLPKGEGWRLASAPEGNLNTVFVEGERALFVPHVAGDHAFVREGAGVTRVSLVTAPAESLPFENHNYYPTAAVAEADEGVWIAEGLRARISLVDPETLAVKESVPVGAWPVAVAAAPGGALLVVAQRGEDTLALVDRATRRVVRTVWIGDEPSSVTLTPDGAHALVLSSTDREAVLVSLAEAKVVFRAKVGADPTYAVVSKDGARAWVLGRRTGRDAAKNGADLSEVNLATGAVTRAVEEVGTTLGGLALSEGGDRLYVTALRNNEAGSLARPDDGSFRHTVVVYDLAGPGIVELLAKEVTLSAPKDPASPLAARRLTSLHAPVALGSALWLLAEASDLAVRFDRATLEEVERVEVPGRPRALAAAAGGRLFAYGHQALAVTRIAPRADGPADVRTSAALAQDPRPEAVAKGQRFFTGAGRFLPAGPPGSGMAVAGDRWSCNSCHADGASDQLVWQAGPVPSHRYVARPFTLLEGTWPLGWQGYLSSIRNYAFTVTGNVGINRPTTEEAETLYAYLASLAAPPAANGLTERDGALSTEALAGADVFARDCASCHAGPLTTSRRRVNESVGDGKVADIPTLLGAYRQGTWFRKGEPASLGGAVSAMATWIGAAQTAEETRTVTRYVAELTGRDFFVLSQDPRPGAPLPVGRPVRIAFSLAPFPSKENADKVSLVGADGARLDAEVTFDGRWVVVTPRAPLPHGSKGKVVIADGFESATELRTQGAATLDFATPTAPALRLAPSYDLAYTPPAFGPPGGPPPAPGRVRIDVLAQAAGTAQILVRYPGAPSEWAGTAYVDGRTLHLPPMPLAVSTSFADGFSGFVGELADDDGDGLADRVDRGTGAEGAREYSMTGPGFEITGLGWSLARAAD